MAIKLLVSKPTKNVLTETSPNSFYLNSDYPLLKIHSYGTFSFNVALEDTTINHNLGYRPFVLTFSKAVINDDGDVSDEFYQHDWFIGGAILWWWGETRIYTNSLIISVGESNATRGGTITGFYYIFKDEVV
jgi:hypothetical protein